MNHTLTISLKSNDHSHISHGQNKIQMLFNELNNSNKFNSLVSLPNKKTYITVLRSPHIDKKSREQFVYKTSKANISFVFSDSKNLDLFVFALNQIEIPGVEIKITMKEWKYLSV
jgi:small subunit ribosomal protein S10